MPDAPVWVLPEALGLLQDFEKIAAPLHAHVALTGGVLFKGYSCKDLDVVVYPHQKKTPIKPLEIMQAFGATNIMLVNYHPDDGKEVYVTTLLGRRVDFFFVS